MDFIPRISAQIAQIEWRYKSAGSIVVAIGVVIVVVIIIIIVVVVVVVIICLNKNQWTKRIFTFCIDLISAWQNGNQQKTENAKILEYNVRRADGLKRNKTKHS